MRLNPAGRKVPEHKQGERGFPKLNGGASLALFAIRCMREGECARCAHWCADCFRTAMTAGGARWAVWMEHVLPFTPPSGQRNTFIAGAGGSMPELRRRPRPLWVGIAKSSMLMESGITKNETYSGLSKRIFDKRGRGRISAATGTRNQIPLKSLRFTGVETARQIFLLREIRFPCVKNPERPPHMLPGAIKAQRAARPAGLSGGF
jgi:hypothetical protein